jgi:hypothetical protein
MKQELDNDSIGVLIKCRIERTTETLLEAETLIKIGFYNATDNRLYYACYYSVLKNRIKAQTTLPI